jgi:hypothetical protein
MREHVKALSEDNGVKSKKTVNHWARLTGMLFLFMAVSGFLRAYGALKQRSVLLEFGLSEQQFVYLLVAGLLYGLVNLMAFVAIAKVGRRRLIVSWLSALLSILLYWIERLFLWVPEQRGGNWPFMLLLHVVLLVVLLLFSRSERKAHQQLKEST